MQAAYDEANARHAPFRIDYRLRHRSGEHRWVIESARKRGENSMPAKLAGELLEASENRGGAVKKREETHRMAEANKAFAHYRW